MFFFFFVILIVEGFKIIFDIILFGGRLFLNLIFKGICFVLSIFIYIFMFFWDRLKSDVMFFFFEFIIFIGIDVLNDLLLRFKFS